MNTEPYTIAGQGEMLEPPALLSRIKTTYDQLAADIAALQDQATQQLALAQKLAQRSGFDVSFGGAQPTPQPNGSDLAGLEAFLNKPYLLRPIQGDRYELIVPQFINLNAGWPARTEGQYVIYHSLAFHRLSDPAAWVATG